MKTRSLGLLLFFIFSFIALHPVFAAGGLSREAFHAPQTEAEKALNNIQVQGNTNPGISSYITIKGHAKDPGLFTNKFVNAAREKNKALERCTPENPCVSVGFNPLTCGAQDSSAYDQLFHTIKENKHEAIIMSTWRENLSPSIEGPVYKMVRDGTEWKLDGVACGEHRFNMD